MADGLLVSLRSYRARPDRDSLEDFITEAFCWLLKQSPRLSAALFERINAELPEAKRFSLPEDQPEWQTQVTLGSNRIDMMASWPGMRLIFEHKVCTLVVKDQLSRYAAAVQEYFPLDDRRLVLITANRAQHVARADVCCCWSDIYQLALSLAESLDTELEQAYLQEFLGLLQHEGLAPPAPIDHQAIYYYPVARDLPAQLESVLAPLQHEDWPVPKAYSCRFKQHWGRIGLEFYLENALGEWSPGLFLGCVLDGRDHRIHHRHKDTLQMQLILDFSSYLHKQFSSMASYMALKENLAKAVSADANGWSVYDHVSDTGGTNKPNNYHPLYLERPLLEVFRGSRATKEQQKRFCTLGRDVLDLVQRAGLADLMDECGRVTG